MLILTRKLNEKIKIGENIVLTVLDIKKNNITIGIDAPKDILILRKEVYDNTVRENLLSSRKYGNIEEFVQLWGKNNKK